MTKYAIMTWNWSWWRFGWHTSSGYSTSVYMASKASFHRNCTYASVKNRRV